MERTEHRHHVVDVVGKPNATHYDDNTGSHNPVKGHRRTRHGRYIDLLITHVVISIRPIQIFSDNPRRATVSKLEFSNPVLIYVRLCVLSIDEYAILVGDSVRRKGKETKAPPCDDRCFSCGGRFGCRLNERVKAYTTSNRTLMNNHPLKIAVSLSQRPSLEE